MNEPCTRREWLRNSSGILAAAEALSPVIQGYTVAPASTVAIAACPSYGNELLPAMEKMFDQIGGLGRIVKGKTVAIKINLTGAPSYRLGYAPLEDSHYTHPKVIATTVYLMGKAGARRIRLVESPWSSADPVEENMLLANWEPKEILKAAPLVEFENTNFLGRAKKYSRFKVPRGGYIYPGFDLNHSYEDCDVFVSLAKMKEHATAGITFSLKNCFGIAPVTIYGEGAGKEEPSLLPKGGRSFFHAGHRQPSRSAPQENEHKVPREGGYRVPRIVVDLVSARPIDLAIVEAVKTMTGGEGPWIQNRNLQVIQPGVIVAGTNPVSTDAVCAALMGFDPMADRGTAPFETCDNTLRLAEEVGLGTRDLKRIEVVGASIGKLRFDIRKYQKMPLQNSKG